MRRFELRRGEVMALVGQSGSGKSTLAKMITGIERPTQGRIVFHGPNGDQDVGRLHWAGASRRTAATSRSFSRTRIRR